jgi:hypothetical protein
MLAQNPNVSKTNPPLHKQPCRPYPPHFTPLHPCLTSRTRPLKIGDASEPAAESQPEPSQKSPRHSHKPLAAQRSPVPAPATPSSMIPRSIGIMLPSLRFPEPNPTPFGILQSKLSVRAVSVPFRFVCIFVPVIRHGAGRTVLPYIARDS